jgi:hypothetical protein
VPSPVRGTIDTQSPTNTEVPSPVRASIYTQPPLRHGGHVGVRNNGR